MCELTLVRPKGEGQGAQAREREQHTQRVWQIPGAGWRHESGRGKWEEVRPERWAGTRTCPTLEAIVKSLGFILCALGVH